MLSHSSVEMTSDRSSCVKNKQRELERQFRCCLLSYLHTPGPPVSSDIRRVWGAECRCCWPSSKHFNCSIGTTSSHSWTDIRNESWWCWIRCQMRWITADTKEHFQMNKGLLILRYHGCSPFSLVYIHYHNVPSSHTVINSQENRTA